MCIGQEWKDVYQYKIRLFLLTERVRDTRLIRTTDGCIWLSIAYSEQYLQKEKGEVHTIQILAVAMESIQTPAGQQLWLPLQWNQSGGGGG